MDGALCPWQLNDQSGGRWTWDRHGEAAWLPGSWDRRSCQLLLVWPGLPPGRLGADLSLQYKGFQAQSINARSPPLCLTPEDLWHPTDLLTDAAVRWDDLKGSALHCQLHRLTQSVGHVEDAP